MNKADVQALVDVYKARLRLDHWNIDVEFDCEFEDGREAEVAWDWSYDNCTVRLKKGWRDWSDEDVAKTVVHELLHILFRDLNVAVADPMAYLPKREQRHVRDRWNHELEGTIERLAVILAVGP